MLDFVLHCRTQPPGLHAFKADLLYLECDLEFHLCPLPRYTIPKPSVFGMHTPSTQKTFLDRTVGLSYQEELKLSHFCVLALHFYIIKIELNIIE
jgi:hypothetical protein